MINLPGTYYDCIRQLRPHIIDLADEDAELLSVSDDFCGVVTSSDDHQTRHDEAIEVSLNEVAKMTAEAKGIPLEEVRSYLRHSGDQDPSILRLKSLVSLEYHCCINFALGNKRTFYLSDHLVEHMAHTAISGSAGNVELPFASCLLVLTSRTAINALHNIKGQKGRWDMNHPSIDYDAPVSVFLTLSPSKDDPSVRNLIVATFQHNFRKTQNPSQIVTKRELHLKPDWSLEQALRTDWGQVAGTPSGLGHTSSIEGDFEELPNDEVFYTDGLAFYRIVLNAVLYMCSEEYEGRKIVGLRDRVSEEAARLSKKERRRKEAYAKNLSELDHEVLGEKMGPIPFRVDRLAGKATGQSSPMQKRILVRGHRKTQRYGKGNAQIKMVWIKPYYKNPDSDEDVSRPYIVK
jgi:hypothetical protein